MLLKVLTVVLEIIPNKKSEKEKLKNIITNTNPLIEQKWLLE